MACSRVVYRPIIASVKSFLSLFDVILDENDFIYATIGLQHTISSKDVIISWLWTCKYQDITERQLNNIQWASVRSPGGWWLSSKLAQLDPSVGAKAFIFCARQILTGVRKFRGGSNSTQAAFSKNRLWYLFNILNILYHFFSILGRQFDFECI